MASMLFELRLFIIISRKNWRSFDAKIAQCKCTGIYSHHGVIISWHVCPGQTAYNIFINIYAFVIKLNTKFKPNVAF